MDFSGAKVALFYGDKLVVSLRDDKPDIPNPNTWDFFGGGREGSETPRECAIREVEEEISITLSPDAFVWERPHPALHDPNLTSYFLVANITKQEVDSIELHEGQRWELMDVEEFLTRPDAIEGMKLRLRDYLASKA